MERWLRMYALALALVPDPDVAGDLFLSARDERDLRRRALAWRAGAGLPDPDPGAATPELTEIQLQHGLHLARRRELRRRAELTMVGLGILFGAACLLFAAVSLRKPPPEGLAAAPVFAHGPMSTAVSTDGVHLRVYAVDANPDSLTAWWEVTGPGAARYRDTVRQIVARIGVTGDILYPHSVDVQPYGSDTLRGRSRYQVTRPYLGLVTLRLDSFGQRPVGLSVQAPATRGLDGTDVRTVQVGRTVRQGEHALTITSVSTSINYVLVRYMVEGPIAPSAGRQLLGAEVDGAWLPWRDTWSDPRAGEAIFAPLPPEGRKLRVFFSPTGFVTAPLSVDEQGSIPAGIARLGKWRRDGTTAEAHLEILEPNVIIEGPAFAQTRANEQFVLVFREPENGHTGLIYVPGRRPRSLSPSA